MREKIIGGFYSALSVAAWVFCFCTLLFGVVLIAAAPDKDPEVTLLSRPVVSAVEKNDPVMLEHGKSGENWYKIETNVLLKSNKYSPWTLEAETLTVKGRDGFTVLPEGGLLFSRAEPQETTLTVYVRWPQGEADLAAHLDEVRLALADSHTSYGFMRFSLHDNVLQFTL